MNMTGTSKTNQSVFSWSMSPEERAFQVDNYYKLNFWESYRGAAILVVFFLLALSLILSFFGLTNLTDVLVGGFVYLILCFFVYKGHRWAIVGLMVLWTADKGTQLYNISVSGEGSVLSIIIWWLVLMPYLYKALKIENTRRVGAPVTIRSEEGVYCVHCGDRQDKDAKFCTACGKQITTTN